MSRRKREVRVMTESFERKYTSRLFEYVWKETRNHWVIYYDEVKYGVNYYMNVKCRYIRTDSKLHKAICAEWFILTGEAL